MNADQLLANYERVAGAPDAVQRLRSFVVDLAVRGKLVPQDPSEEDAAPLLISIKQAWDGRTASGKVKKPKVWNAVGISDAPFEVPNNWALVRLGQAMDLINGRAFKPTDWTPEGMPIVRIQNLNNPTAAFNRFDGDVKNQFLIDTGDFLISWSGTPGTSFGAHIWDRGPAVLNQHIFKAVLIGNAFAPHFLKLAINSRLLEMIEQAHGGVGLQHITKPKLEAVVLTLPPLAEQHRIVAKVDELMALCDQLEAARAEREETRNHLMAMSLAQLNTPDTDPAVFQSHAEFTLENFVHVTARPDHIKALRQTILNLAVRGKLVPQDPSEEDAAPLLISIKQAWDGRTASGKVKKPKVWNAVGISDAPFEVPNNWALVRLGQAMDLINGRAFKPTDWTPEGMPIVRIQNLNNPTAAFNRFDGDVKNQFLIDTGDFLISWSGTPGTSFGAHIWDRGPAVLNQHIFKAVLIGNAFAPHFLKLAINSRLLEMIEQAHGGVGLQHITKPKLEAVVLTLPPLAEQHRIVAKVDELMALCDQLEVSLAIGDDTRRQLLDALLHETLAPATTSRNNLATDGTSKAPEGTIPTG